MGILEYLFAGDRDPDNGQAAPAGRGPDIDEGGIRTETVLIGR